MDITQEVAAITEEDQRDPSIGATSNKPRKRRRPKPKIELSPDQPPTTQGKPRCRVYVACLQCRTRKIRCDGAKPVCHNCKRRACLDCEYDTSPKRRGPDKTPGARQRIARELRLGNPELPRRRRRTQQAEGNAMQDRQMSILESEPIPPPQELSYQGSLTHGFLSLSHYKDKCSCHGINYCPMATYSSVVYQAVHVSLLSASDCRCALNCAQEPAMVQNLQDNADAFLDAGRGYPTNFHDEQDETEPTITLSIDNEPSLRFARKIWWDSLLCLYLSPNSKRLQSLTSNQREIAARSITSDLRFVFRASNHWFSFMHIPTFFGEFYDPVRREGIQPCLVLSLLAMATFWKSSEVEMAKQGRERALRLRDEAQAALEASINSRWIDETVVQAAWVLALFEVCAHPRHSSQRALSALTLLDSLVQSLSLTLLDVNDIETSSFSPQIVPSTPEKTNFELYQDLFFSTTGVNHFTRHASTGCGCKAMALATNWSQTDEHVPLWRSTPAWHATWTTGEIRKESCRRLCWSSLALAAGHVSYAVANWEEPPDLFITNPANYALLFSGMSLARSSALPPGKSSKDTVWALYDRSFLLWHGCARMRYDQNVPDADKAQFAVKAWLEADALEAALDKHTCNLERAFLYQAREYLFNTRMCISYEFQRWIPLVTANVNNMFHRNKAEEWLTHQATVGRRLMNGLHTVTGNCDNVLARRPFFLFWFMGQINRAMTLWEYDNSLLPALDVCKALVTAVDYLSSLWPCPGTLIPVLRHAPGFTFLDQRKRYENLRQKVDNACHMAGVCPPPALNLKVVLPKSLDLVV
ncbi:hypothetical protein JOM56_010510 [Amanita muscaria]